MKGKILTSIKYILFLSVGIFLVWWSIHKMSDKDWADCKLAIQSANYLLFIPVFFILVLSHISRTIRWKILMKPLGYAPSFHNTFFAVMIGYLANLAFPRLGEVLKCTILAKYEKVPADKLVGTIIIERAVDVISLLIVFVVAIVTQASIIKQYATVTINKYFLNNGMASVYTKLLLLFALLIAFLVLWKFVIKKYSHISGIQKIKGIVLGVKDGLTSVKKLENKWLFIFHSLLIWTCYILGTYLGFSATIGTSNIPFLAAFPVLAFASIGMIVTPGGVGLYPILVMEVLLLYNIQSSIGFANGMLQWVAQFVIILSVGGVCAALLPYFNKSVKTDTNSTF
jgi:glycosyltransferase 2 family protein